ncbi:MAG TPA: hypothetical protein VMU53_12545 [Candidatus Sulfotelmatobacter sp.]|nr:hypothetical protein [Candidatus Sulfotelmatobacter sp.]
MRHLSLLVLGFLLMPSVTLGQSGSPDSQTLQALLTEVRQLRQELRSTTSASLRAQILIYRVQAQEAAVARVQERLDDATTRHSQLTEKRKQFASQLKFYADKKEGMTNPDERQKYDDAASELKVEMDTEMTDLQELETKQAELKEELRSEEAKLGRLQDELDRLDKTLESAETPTR